MDRNKMKTATENLENDHVYILRLIDIMQALVVTEAPDVTDLESVVFLISNYADGIHHEKEEQLLFPRMSEKGFSMNQGPVAVMLQEHERGRNFVKGMRSGIARYKEGDADGLQLVRENMAGYVSLLTNHIAKENNILFRMADQAFSERDQSELLEEFSRIENAGGANGIYKQALDTIARLVAKYLA